MRASGEEAARRRLAIPQNLAQDPASTMTAPELIKSWGCDRWRPLAPHRVFFAAIRSKSTKRRQKTATFSLFTAFRMAKNGKFGGRLRACELLILQTRAAIGQSSFCNMGLEVMRLKSASVWSPLSGFVYKLGYKSAGAKFWYANGSMRIVGKEGAF